jgi:ribosome biogenesis GTPase
MKGKVLKSTGSWYTVLAEDGRILDCRTRGKLRLEGFETTNPIAVGDKVEIKEAGDYNIEKIYPRINYIIRQSVKKKSQSHIIAANLNQAALVVTMAFPRTSTGFIDRYLVTAEAYEIPQLLIFNKIDLLKKKEKAKMNSLIETYEKIGVKCFQTSAETKAGLDDLEASLAGKITLMSGHSGVGKSTLLNIIDPQINQEIKEVSKWTEKGQHTTTFAEMFLIGDNTFIIDTPGIKELGLVEMEPEEISDYFPEMRKLQEFCRFNNCTHTHEPDCAVKEALEQEEIAPFRYANYLSMLKGEESHR